ncbi:MAG: HIRAN domain-containing protein [Nigerium sp.]|nr:HIRAN domain-containing protein [Nigerium sp.]
MRIIQWVGLLVVAAVLSAVPGIGVVLALVVVVVGGAVLLTRGGSKPQIASSTPVAALAAGETVTLPVVGLRHHQGIDHLTPGSSRAVLKREPRNPHDRNAVAVWTGKAPRMTGYLSAQDAQVVGPRMDASGKATLVVGAVSSGRDLRVLIPAEFAGGAGLPDDPRLWPTTLTPWGRLSRFAEVEDEYLHRAEVRRIFTTRGVAIGSDAVGGSEISDVAGVLASSQTSAAVYVVIDGTTVGRLEDPAYAAAVRAADARQAHIPIRARVWAVDDDGTIRSRVTVMLPEPDQIMPPGPLPAEPHVILPHGSRVNVTGEEAHLSELSAILAGKPEAPVVATLHEQLPVGRSTRSRVLVRIDGDDVGVLTPGMSDHFLPIIRACAEERLTVACRASAVGNALKADVVLDACRSGDLPHEWIAEHVQPRLS